MTKILEIVQLTIDSKKLGLQLNEKNNLRRKNEN